MGVTPGRLGRRYAPFIVLAAVQVLLVAIVPSKGLHGNGTPSQVASGGPAGSAGSGAGGSTGVAGAGSTGAGSGSAATAPGATGIAGGSGATTTGSGTGSTGAGSTGTEAVDRSRCDANGKEAGPTFYMPPCVPVWHGGDNGGRTMTGVDATTIRIVFYVAQSNPEVNAILARQDLAATNEQRCEALRAFTAEVNKRWELYGRKLVSLDGPGTNKGSVNSDQPNCRFPYFQGQCSLTPPDPPCERAEAQLIADQIKPAFVLAPVADPAFYNELGKRHIVVLGGEAEPASYHTDVAPYYWDVFMDGTRAVRMLAEYYCKKMVGKPVRWAGPEVMHPPGTDPLGPAVKRKVAILYPSTKGDPTARLSANLFIQLVSGGECGSPGDDTKGYSYESDINTAEQQSTTTAVTLKHDHVTTVVCFCDPIAPVFGTNSFATQDYHPELLLAGIGLIDYDKLGRLYNPSVQKYAFGLSHLQTQLPFDQSEAAKAWRDAGNPGLPDKTENLDWAYYALVGAMIQNAGPNLTPANVSRGMFAAPPEGGWQLTGGNPHYPLIVFRPPDDYTGINDAREVYWCSTRPSEIDGQLGSYAPVDNGHRYDLGQWPGGDPKVFPNDPCAG
jgi:hypothetical protein